MTRVSHDLVTLVLNVSVDWLSFPRSALLLKKFESFGQFGNLLFTRSDAKCSQYVEFIGTVATKNPRETLNKIRMGQPGVPMTSVLAFDVQDHVDRLSYLQILPPD